jgi:hypothetical protein
MNKQQAIDLKPILNHWANGGKIASIDHTKTKINNGDVEELHWVSLNYLVINDDYVEFRMALKRGETVQLKLNNEYQDIEKNYDFTHQYEQYRIKPKVDLSWIKDGAYCRMIRNGQAYRIKYSEEKENFHIDGFDNYYNAKELSMSTIEWKPLKGDLCWFYDHDGQLPYLSKYTETSKDNDTYIHLSKSNDMWKKCIPYIGEKFWINK